MIKFEHVSKEFTDKNGVIEAVNDVNLEIEKGEIYGIIGFSGAGKSTLVRCINLLEAPTSGKVFFDGVDLTAVSQKQLRIYRQKIGMIFQLFNLLEQRTVAGNISYPLEIAGEKKQNIEKRIKELLELVGLTDKANAYPSQLSGGQKQRVAIARALATNPAVLLCDEATSALDPITTRSILQLLKQINKTLGVTIVVITHEMRVVEQICNKVAVMSEGTIQESGTVKEVFLNPKSETARRLILPDRDELDTEEDRKVLRVVFDGQSSFEPVIAELVLHSKVMVNILGANTANIGGRAFGQILLELPEDEKSVEAVKTLLKRKGIHFEEGGKADD